MAKKKVAKTPKPARGKKICPHCGKQIGARCMICPLCKKTILPKKKPAKKTKKRQAKPTGLEVTLQAEKLILQAKINAIDTLLETL